MNEKPVDLKDINAELIITLHIKRSIHHNSWTAFIKEEKRRYTNGQYSKTELRNALASIHRTIKFEKAHPHAAQVLAKEGHKALYRK